MCLSVLPPFMLVYYVLACCLWRPEGTGSPGTEFTDGCKVSGRAGYLSFVKTALTH